MANLQQSLDNYIEAADELQPSPDENQMAKFEQNIDSAQATHLKSRHRLNELCLLLEQNADAPMSSPISEETVKPRLAPLHIPKLGWEWDRFWGVFDAVVHRRNLSKIEKMSYLLEALEGPAKDTVSKLQVTADNYEVAIQLLMKKYDNQEMVVNYLLQELQDIQTASTTITDQMDAMDKILAIISQLKRRGENTEAQHMRRAILRKSCDKIQRTILKKRASSQGLSWSTKQLLQDLQVFFEMEAQIENIREPRTKSSTLALRQQREQPNW
uniref:Uncharacterized protein n=1 Tax=Haemonchus contortus TaxID=6289 RepID=A0A7I4YV34_HAECO